MLGDKFLYRNGDLLIRQIDKLPKGLKKLDTNILAEGQFTGHNHKIVAEPIDLTIYTDNEGKKYFNLNKDSDLTHQEHKTIKIKKGLYELVIEQEFDPFQEVINQVKD